MRDASAARLMERVVHILTDSLTPSGIDQWLHASNRLLGGLTPLDLIDDGDTSRVEVAAQAFVDGAYV